MSMRISSGGLILLLAACSQGATETQPEEGERIECALGGAQAFSRSCILERTQRVGGAILTVRHPDGSFRNFLLAQDEWSDDPTTLDTADGAQRAVVIAGQTHTDVAVGKDRYRFPWKMPARVEP